MLVLLLIIFLWAYRFVYACAVKFRKDSQQIGTHKFRPLSGDSLSEGSGESSRELLDRCTAEGPSRRARPPVFWEVLTDDYHVGWSGKAQPKQRVGCVSACITFAVAGVWLDYGYR